MLYRRTWSYQLFRVVNALIMLAVLAAIIIPFLNLLAISLSESWAIVGGKVGLFPIGFNLDAYFRIFQHPSIKSGFYNSFLQTGLGTAIGLFMLTICAYPLSKTFLKGRKLFILFIMFTMFFSGGLIPTYLVVKSLGLIDTIWAIVLPFCITPYYLLLVMTYFQSIPESLEESAMIDGLNPIQILWRIVIPLSKPVLAAITLFLAIYYWNNWFNAMIYLNSTEKLPVMMIVRNIVAGADLASNGGQSEVTSLSAASLKSAAIMVTTLPVVVLFPFAQKHFAQGVMLGAVKG
ncbi:MULTISPECIES: carbohydrate ABC transporter permease [Paenibacillus]|uniref:Carbohydrate ABC transporter permease n=1 Tax=Paenibacillus chondroitinus TaxID=59842 RepID=A0ABU6DBA4_9BACL|nr:MULTISPECIES: carbohydrate ABC transporter permease [Paenibacillus]MCY9662287.1 carbohydrate ABC transporter permease [Paenibacillus anseongense]MEB4794675.1 carbohydrate ABC transporter permease [Paenibacillus chondroitinus]